MNQMSDPKPSSSHRISAALPMFLIILAVSFGFYGNALDNGFWHPEDFEVLQAAQELRSPRDARTRCQIGRAHV